MSILSKLFRTVDKSISGPADKPSAITADAAVVNDEYAGAAFMKPDGGMMVAYKSGKGWYVPLVQQGPPGEGDRMVMLNDDGKVESYVFRNGGWISA